MGEVPREPVIEYFLWLAREGLEREPNQVWNSLAAESVGIEARVVFPEIRRAYEEDLIDRMFMAPAELVEAEAAPAGHQLQKTIRRYPPIDHVVAATAWWGCFEGNGTQRIVRRRRERRRRSDAMSPVPVAVARSTRSAAAAEPWTIRGWSRT